MKAKNSFLKQPKLVTAQLLCFALTAATASAQDKAETAQAETQKLDDYVVTSQFLYSEQVNALKTPTPIIDVPQSLSIFTSDQIQNQGFDSIRDLIDYTPGVTTSQGEGHRDSVVFRGVRSTADFYVDGVRDDVQYYRSLYNVEQVEFLRGPNALLFGRGGTGGIINRVIKKGELGQNFNEYQVAVDTFGAYSAQLDSNYALSESAAFRINLAYEYLDNHRDNYGGERWGVNPTFKFKLRDRTTLDVSYEYLNHDRFIDRGIPTGRDGEPVEDFEDIFFGDKDQNNAEFEAHVLRAALQHNFSEELKARLDFAYGDYDKFYENIYSSKYAFATDITANPDEVTLDGYVDTTQRKNLMLSGNLISEFETGSIGHTLIVGAEFINSENNNDRFVTTPDVFNLTTYNGTTGLELDIFKDDTRADLNVFSFYLQNQIAISEKLDLLLGARFDHFDFEVDSLDGAGNKTTRSRTDEEVTPRLGIVFKPQENISIYASYSETFLPRSGEQFASISDKTQALEPDTYTNLEAGVKWDFDNGLSLTTSIFELQKSSPETGRDDALALAVVESTIHGFEAQLQGMLTDKWFISAGYSYLDGEVESNKDDDGNRPRELPEHMLSLWNNYQLTDRIGLGLGGIYQSETYIDNGNDTKLPGYFRIDAAAYYDINENLRVQLNIENLTDELYFPNAHADHQATVGAPISARIALIGRF
ncbi:MAG: catecholate siderophore receptor [Candidatus Azotimanducaceae bacterium]|jgi:catecholate siderophore receptor